MRLLLVPALLLALVPACAERVAPPQGASVRIAAATQKVQPLPPEPLPVEGMDGGKAAQVMENYRKTEKKPLEFQMKTSDKIQINMK